MWKPGWNCRRWFSQHTLRGNSLERAYLDLDLPVGASPAEVKAAYRRRALKCHPDLHRNDSKEFMHITAAYERIMKRGSYVRHGVSAAPQFKTRIFHESVAFWWVSLLLGSILFWYPSQMYFGSGNTKREPSRLIEPSRDAIKRERIAAILFERQRKEKEKTEAENPDNVHA